MAALAGCNLLHLPDLDWVGTGKVPGPQVSGALCDRACSGQVTLLLVRVVGAAPGVIAQSDAKDLHP